MLLHNQNFQQEYPAIHEKIQCADFISLDLEFTGLYKKDPLHKINYFSSIYSIYSALHESISHYSILQVGFSIFHTTNDNKAFSSYYFHPNNSNDLTSDPESLTFLLLNNYDFFQTFTKRLSYVSPSHFNSVVSDSNKRLKNKNASLNPHKFFKLIQKSNYFDFINGSENYVFNIDTSVGKFVDEYLNNAKENKDITFTFDLNIDEPLTLEYNNNKKKDTNKEDDIKNYILRSKHNVKDLILKYLKVILNKHKSKLKQTEYRLQYSFTYDLETTNKLEYNLTINKKSIAKEEKKDKVLNCLFKKNHSSEIVKDLLLSGKPIVVHSGGFDLLFLIHNFIFELPETYNEFIDKLHWYQGRHLYSNSKLNGSKEYKELVKLENEFDCLNEKDNYFKFKLLDTKMLMSLQFNSELLEALKVEKLGNLGNCFELLFNHFKEKEGSMEYKADAGDLVESGLKAHHAGFDAEITGKVFYYISKLVNKNLLELESIKNHIFLYNSFTTMNLGRSIKEREKYYERETKKIIIVKDEESSMEKSIEIDKVIAENNINVKRMMHLKNSIYLHVNNEDYCELILKCLSNK
eukprot:GAHX01001697.1.p1 GENE.GAHX01001697.1~~GAHX01001697.1.p1  ORF type:complete len:592 (-),score=146.20 GAHX01001697.1:945-2678(-)